ncbi:MAG: UvrD-helicase domain-containing protein [Bdellovibrionales bacterium]|nr:UvrD-helicase domain-containing protein [Bdellovibrionales bacterium]
MSLAFQPLQLCEASAGSGKTFQLAHRYVSLLAHNQDPDSILASTFSRKASAEIFNRILSLLILAAEDESAAREIAERIGVPPFTSSLAVDLLRRVLKQLSTLPIGTLDSYAQRVARLFAGEIGLPSDWDIPSVTEENLLNEEALREVLEAHTDSERKQLFSLITSPDASRTVFSRLHGKLSKLSLIAAAGSPSDWSWSYEDLSIEVPAGADREEKELLQIFKSLEIPTTKAGAPDKRWQKALESSVQLVENGDWVEFISKGVALAILNGSDTFQSREIPDRWVDAFSRALKLARYSLGDLLIRRTEIVRNFLSTYGEKVFSLKVQYRSFGFSDVKHTLSSSMERIDFQHLLYRLDRRIQHVLLDEFQDTTAAEWHMLQMLVDEIASDPGGTRSLFVVGDPKQSIYGWRGGLPELFSQLRERYSSMALSTLDHSYRSSPVIVDRLNEVFLGLNDCRALGGYEETVQQWMEHFTEHQSARGELAGFSSVRIISEEEDADVGREGVLAREVSQLHRENPHLEIAVLVRTNKELAPFVYALEREGLPVSAEGGSAITDSPVVLALVHCLHLLSYPRDSRSRYHVQTTPLGAFLEEHFESIDRALQPLRDRIAGEGIAGCLRYLARGFSSASCTKDETRFEQLFRLALLADEKGGGTLEEFLKEVRAHRVEEAAHGFIRVMTIHKSKGLEFDAVFLPELGYPLNRVQERDVLKTPESSTGPHRVILYPDRQIRALFAPLQQMYEECVHAQLKEELSVLYVAMSRAKHALYCYLSSKEERGITAEAIVASRLLCPPEQCREVGDATWYRRAEKMQGGTSFPSKGKLTLKSAVKNRCRIRFFPVENPSQSVSNIGLRSLSDSEKRGRTLHQVFEQIEWVSEFSVGDHSQGLSTEDVQLLSRLQESPFLEILIKERYQNSGSIRIYRELPFSYFVRRRNNERHLMSGVIDRVVVTEHGGVEVMEFKTGYLSESSEVLRQKFSEQLSAYAEAVQRVFPESARGIKLFLLLIDRGEVLECSP